MYALNHCPVCEKIKTPGEEELTRDPDTGEYREECLECLYDFFPDIRNIEYIPDCNEDFISYDGE